MRNLVIIAAAICICLVGCKPSLKTTKSGIKYRVLDNQKGKQHAKEGDIVNIHIKTFFEDSLIFDSRDQNGGRPVPFTVAAPRFNGDLAEVLPLMTPGDSTLFQVSIDTLNANKQKLQPWMKEGKYISYFIKMESIKTADQHKEEQKKEAAEAGDPKKDDEQLQAYFKKNNLTPKKTQSGIYYIITSPTDGMKPLSGKSVFVNYTGRLMNGTEFDSNKGGEPLKFLLGRGQVILGWDEGIALLKKGEKATLYIPSHLAYGANSPSPKIPANSILVFDVELVDF